MKSDQSDMSSSSASHGLSDYVIDHRIEGTTISLTVNIRSGMPIQPADMVRTLIQTQLRLRTYIRTHYRAEEDMLLPGDNPYVSDERFTGCYLGVSTWPMEGRKRLTYGMLNSALTGIFDVLYRKERFVGAEFFVVDDELGRVGIGMVNRDRPNTRLVVSEMSSA